MSDTGYQVLISNGTVLGGGNYEVQDVSQVANSIADTSLTSLALIRRGARNYTEALSEDLVHMLENFASSTQPVNPMYGQLWWTPVGNFESPGELYVWGTNGQWNVVANHQTQSLINPITLQLVGDASANTATITTNFANGVTVQIPSILPNTGVVAGTYTSPTLIVDSKGRITSATSVSISASLGYVPASTGQTSGQSYTAVNKAGDTMSGQLNAPSFNVPTAGGFLVNGSPLQTIPSGVIVMWSGAQANIPAGWVLCNGTNGAPNLMDRFVVGAGNTYSVGQAAGSAFLTVNSSSAGGSSGASTQTDTQGSHSHFGATAGAALSVDQLPPHQHTIPGQTMIVQGGPNPETGLVTAGASATKITDSTGSGNPHSHGINTDGSHAHNLNIPAGLVPAHVHSTSWDNRPPYYALCFIMKT
jgi:hypothetical protein